MIKKKIAIVFGLIGVCISGDTLKAMEPLDQGKTVQNMIKLWNDRANNPEKQTEKISTMSEIMKEKTASPLHDWYEIVIELQNTVGKSIDELKQIYDNFKSNEYFIRLYYYENREKVSKELRDLEENEKNINKRINLGKLYDTLEQKYIKIFNFMNILNYKDGIESMIFKKRLENPSFKKQYDIELAELEKRKNDRYEKDRQESYEKYREEGKREADKLTKEQKPEMEKLANKWKDAVNNKK